MSDVTHAIGVNQRAIEGTTFNQPLDLSPHTVTDGWLLDQSATQPGGLFVGGLFRRFANDKTIITFLAGAAPIGTVEVAVRDQVPANHAMSLRLWFQDLITYEATPPTALVLSAQTGVFGQIVNLTPTGQPVGKSKMFLEVITGTANLPGGLDVYRVISVIFRP